MPVHARAKTTGHCRIFQVHSKAAPRFTQSATFSASVGPTITSANEIRMKSATPVVRRIAVDCTFHHGRPSSMSYALFSVLMIAVMADELLHRAVATPKVRSPAGFAFLIF